MWTDLDSSSCYINTQDSHKLKGTTWDKLTHRKDEQIFFRVLWNIRIRYSIMFQIATLSRVHRSMPHSLRQQWFTSILRCSWWDVRRFMWHATYQMTIHFSHLPTAPVHRHPRTSRAYTGWCKVCINTLHERGHRQSIISNINCCCCCCCCCD